ncbi:MAG: hypothetical protein H6622_16500 [Halobacteriovoraceae bacterium]|nr:hypothetical protein [Halobacteriovoraceae bacterium]
MLARWFNFFILVFFLLLASCGKGKINIKLYSLNSKTAKSTASSLMGSWNGFGGAANDVVFRNNYVYLAKDLRGLEIYNASDSSSIFLVGRYDTAGVALGVSLSSDWNYAYVADGTNGLVVVDITTQTNPILYSP